jgi:hypothetical protein
VVHEQDELSALADGFSVLVSYGDVVDYERGGVEAAVSEVLGLAPNLRRVPATQATARAAAAAIRDSAAKEKARRRRQRQQAQQQAQQQQQQQAGGEAGGEAAAITEEEDLEEEEENESLGLGGGLRRRRKRRRNHRGGGSGGEDITGGSFNPKDLIQIRPRIEWNAGRAVGWLLQRFQSLQSNDREVRTFVRNIYFISIPSFVPVLVCSTS